jgi:hypothetical protein
MPLLLPNPYQCHRLSAELISHCVWLSFRLCLSYRDVEEPTAEHGVILTYAGYILMASPFRPRRHRLSAPAYPQKIAQQFQIW